MMNTIIEKQLANLSQEQTDSIMDSFFAGCVKYDLYDLAIKFNTLSINELYTYQELLQNPRTPADQKYEIYKEIIRTNSTGNQNNTIDDETGKDKQDVNSTRTNSQQGPDSNTDKKGQLQGDLDKFNNYGFYFDNDFPIGSTYWKTEVTTLFTFWYNKYIALKNTDYNNRAPIEVSKTGERYFKTSIPSFFSDVIEGNFKEIRDVLIPKKLKEVLVDYKGAVKITLVGSASAPATNNYNINLSKRRNSTVINWLRTQTIGDKTIKQWEEEGKIKFEFDANGEDIVINKDPSNNLSNSVNCTSGPNESDNIVDVSNGKVTQNSQWYSIPAMACRRVAIKKIEISDFEEPPKRYSCDGNGNCYEDENGEFETEVKCKEKCTPQPSPVVDLKTYDCINGKCEKVENGPYTGITQCENEGCGEFVVTAITTNPQPTPTPTIQKKIKEGISKKVLRTLFSECDYFEIIKESNPTVYASIKDKIKYFSPAFHSITPEGLNARLTFLNQCVRPGQTIPVIGPDGKPKYNDARNTSFGAPPVLVLRVGDFYHTKIIPNQLSITYEPLLYDINPEGIGVQPMIAKISLGFDFIGGHGLAGPVQELQNALSFNFYANTEIYDERSTPTESTKERDENLVQQIITKNPGLSAADTSNQNDINNQLPETGGNTIGNILTEDYFDDNSYQTGTTEFNTIFNQLSEDTNSYFTTIFNQLKTINEVTNYPILQLVSEERNFQDGKLGLVPLIDISNGNLETTTKIFGKPIKYENKITKVVNEVLNDINDNTNPLIKPIESSNANYSKATKREFKNKVYEIVSQQDAKINERIINYLNEISNSQQEYVQIFKKMDLVVAQIDGYRLETGKFKVYSISPKEDSSDSLQNIRGDIYPSPLDEQLEGYLSSLENNKIVYADTIDENGTSFTPVYQPDTITIPDPTGSGGTIEIPAEPFLLTNKDRRFYMVMSDIFTDDNKYNTFVESIITERVKGNTSMVNLIKETCESIRKQHLLEFEAEKKLFIDYETSQEYIDNYLNFKINNLENTSFEFNYTTQTNSDTKDKQKELKTAYSDLNTIKKKNTFNGKVYFD